MLVVNYSKEFFVSWNEFIRSSKNGTFMLDRNYMDYHSNRFVDHSLMFYEDDTLLAVMPASLHDNELRSHGGLTYGGIISDKKMTVQKMLDVFSCLKNHMREYNINKLIYKRIPYIYYKYPSDEDLYALFINEANLIRRDISTTIDLYNRVSFAKGKKCGISKAKRSGVEVNEFDEFDLFFEYENKLLQQKYNTTATHISSEMKLLSSKFPENIKMFGGFLNGNFLAGTIIFITKPAAHTQYIVTTELGRELGAFDLVIDYLVNYCILDVRYFDFGISSEQDGLLLNSGLVHQKEMFGGRATVYDFYELNV